MAKHDTTMPTFYMLSALKCTGAGFTKWTSSVVPPYGHQLMANHSWSYYVSAMVLCMLSLAWTVQGVAAADLAGFARHCAGFAQDPLLGALWPDTSEPRVETRSTVLTSIVPRSFLRGTALATYE